MIEAGQNRGSQWDYRGRIVRDHLRPPLLGYNAPASENRMYYFRIRFALAPNTTINVENAMTDVHADIAGGPYVIKTVGNVKLIAEASELILNSRGFDTEQAAWDAGRAAKAALLVTAAQLGIGIDAGRDTPIGVFHPEYLEELSEAQGMRVLNDVHGLVVYDDAAETTFVSAHGKGSLAKGGHAFLTALASSIKKNLQLTNRDSLSLELLSLSQFESSQRARFLTLVMAVEAQLELPERPPKSLALVDRFIAETREADLEDNEGASILGALEWLRRKSIGQSAKSLIRSILGTAKFGGKTAASFFADCYGLRSKIVHEGEAPAQVSDLGPELNRLVRELLLAKIAG